MSFSNVLTRFVAVHPIPRPASLHSAPLHRCAYTNSIRVHDIPASDFDTLVDGLRAPEHPHVIHHNYPALVAELRERRKNLPVVAPPLNQRHLSAILQKLGESGRPADLQRIEDVLTDMSYVFGVEPSLDVHTTILRALKKPTNLHTMYRWLLHMPLRPGNFCPTIEQFHLVLEACAEFGTFKQMRNMVISMRKAGCKPSIETFKILIRARWEFAAQEDKVPHLIVFSTILEDMKREGLPYNQSVSDLLFSGYADRNMIAYAEQIRTLYQQQFPDAQTPEEEQFLSWNLRLSQVAQSRGIKDAMTMFRSLEKEGCTASPAIVRALLRHSRTLADLKYVEEELKVKPSTEHYSLLVSNSIRTGHISRALAIYDHAKNDGLKPEAALVAPMIKHLCQLVDGEALEDSLDKAFALYKDLSSCHPIDAGVKEKTSYLEHSAGPDLNIYQTLLRGLASSSNIQKYFPVALSLLEDMDARKLSKDDSIVSASIIVLHMRNAKKSVEALTAYQTHRSALDEKGYAVVLNAYSKLTFGESTHVPSLTDYFGIVKDMRHAGLSITTEVYTILLQRLGITATRLNQQRQADDEGHLAELRSSLIMTTRRAHDLLTLDANISPDAHVWNQLMDTYQRLGCFGDAYRVWELMYLSGRFDHVTVSIILDACGYAGAWQVAKQVRKRLSRDKFRFNQHNWNTWIECLCRLGRLDDAVKAACLEMGKNEEASANVESVRILLKFARGSNQQVEVLSRIQRYLPDLWTSLPEELQNP
ncbi:hypothetical protein AX15_001598 [Amanita polypyramis BW_CC]|nr:hypothetical protein AX15_001598 [Amanita polypyramis BW_CC]